LDTALLKNLAFITRKSKTGYCATICKQKNITQFKIDEMSTFTFYRHSS